MTRTISVEAADFLDLHSSLRLKLKRGGRGEPVLRTRTGDDLTVSTGRWAKLDRVIDLEHDHYYEHIVDAETGEVLRHVDEPLSEHRDRGSARTPATSKPANTDPGDGR